LLDSLLRVWEGEGEDCPIGLRTIPSGFGRGKEGIVH
tara:strand:+ start:542 stop:652 length:111 start_codon:yes stop_codon:yes gene_type:complete